MIGLATLAGLFGAEAARAHPARIVIAPRGEDRRAGASHRRRPAGSGVCGPVPRQGRAVERHDLRKGRGTRRLFCGDQATQKTAQPSADSWGEPLAVFSDGDLDAETQAAAAALDSPSKRQDRRCRLGAQAHRRRDFRTRKPGHVQGIAQARPDSRSRGAVKWEGKNYEYFWIIDIRVRSRLSQSSSRTIPAPLTRGSPTTPGARRSERRSPEFYETASIEWRARRERSLRASPAGRVRSRRARRRQSRKVRTKLVAGRLWHFVRRAELTTPAFQDRNRSATYRLLLIVGDEHRGQPRARGRAQPLAQFLCTFASSAPKGSSSSSMRGSIASARASATRCRPP